MKRSIVIAILAASAIVVPGAASAQQVSDEVRRECTSVASDVARIYMDAKRRGVRDIEKGIYRSSTNWGEQVAVYMAQAASRSDSITERELTTLGAVYCIERRPTNVR